MQFQFKIHFLLQICTEIEGLDILIRRMTGPSGVLSRANIAKLLKPSRLDHIAALHKEIVAIQKEVSIAFGKYPNHCSIHTPCLCVFFEKLC